MSSKIYIINSWHERQELARTFYKIAKRKANEPVKAVLDKTKRMSKRKRPDWFTVH